MQMLITTTPGFPWPTEGANAPLPCPLTLLEPTQRILHISLIQVNSGVTSYGTWLESKREGGCFRTGMRGSSSSCLGQWSWSGEQKIKDSVTVHCVCRDITHSIFLFSMYWTPQVQHWNTNTPEKGCWPPPLLLLLTFKFVWLLTTGLLTKMSLIWLSDTHLTTNLVSVHNFNYLPRFIST